ncbi:hypothetical protein DFH07DRAFT_954677 [Mycena maculata]|uniref:Uncharacterized protein n=1 Tax=Mycena maculata TaxID=230809 RepID=A0AAD7JMJ1_9AGAR|nr:hypothetical protein DFH07DRAFT_954677 [Mycena maculata]
MGSPKPKPTTTRPKALPKVSSSSVLFNAFNHHLAYALSLHLLDPDSIIDYTRPELKVVVMGALPVLRYLKRNVNLHDLNDQARMFYGGINRVMECLHTIPKEWYNFCVDEDIYPSDAASLIKAIPPARAKISLGPSDHRPLDKSFVNFNQSDPTPAQIQGFLNNLPAVPPRSPSPDPESEPEPGPVTSSSRLIARAAAPTGLTKKCSFDSADLDALAQDKTEPPEAEPPLDVKPGRGRDLHEKKRARVESPEAHPAKPKKGKNGKEKADSDKIPDAPQCAHRYSGSGTPSHSDKDPDATKISKLIAARVQQAKGSKARTPVQLNVDLDGNSYNLGDPNDIYLYLIRKRAQLVPERFFTGHLTTTAHHRLDSDTYVERFESLELIDTQKILEVDIKDTLINLALSASFIALSESPSPLGMATEIIVDQFKRTATRLADITSLYNDVSIDFAEAFNHLIRHFNSCVEEFGDETFASQFSDSSLAVCAHLADLVAQFRGTFKSFQNLDMSNVDIGKPPRPLSTARALIDIARDPSESVEAVDVDADGAEEVEELRPPKLAPKPSLRPSAAKPSSMPKKPASNPSPAHPPSTRSRAVPKDKE